MATIDRRNARGLVWTVDAVAFSDRGLTDQVEVIEFLSDYVSELAMLADLPQQDYIVHSTGDGFIVTLIDQPGLVWRLLRAAEHLVVRCREWRRQRHRPLQVRQGLHAGQFMHPVPLFDHIEAVGDGLNLGSRIADAAGPEQIYVSEAFVEHVVSAEGENAFRSPRPSLYPQLPGPPHSVPVKHDRFVGIRHVVLPNVDWHRPSPTLMRLFETEERLREELRLVLDVVQRAFAEELGEFTLDRLQVRVSLWEQNRDKLVATHLRTRWDQRRSTSKIGAYKMSPPEGPLARAVAAGVPKVYVGLPGADDLPGAYKAWRDLGLRPDRFGSLGRLPGALVAVPFQFGETGVRGALCIDIAPPMTEHRGALEVLAAMLGERESEHIAALMELRRA